jgi:hypothetical protein
MKKISTILFVLISIFLHAQEDKTIEFGRLAKEDFEVPSKIDTSFGAIVQYDKSELKVEGSDLFIKRVKRIQILNTKRLFYADQGPIIHNRSSVLNIEAYSYYLSDGRVIRSKLDLKDITYKDLNNNFREINFLMPNVKPGCIFEYKYHLRIGANFYMTPWHFQEPIPVLWSEIQATVPNDYQYAIAKKGILDYYKTDKVKNFNNTKFKWIMKDVPAFTDEPYISSPINYRAAIEFQGVNERMNSWSTLTNTIYENAEFCTSLRKKIDEVKGFISGVYSSSDNDEVKCKKIFKLVRESFLVDVNKDYVGFYKDLKSVMKSKNGSASEINLVLTACLIAANINASPVLLSTRDNGFINVNFPLIDRFNLALCSVNLGTKTILLDASDKNLGYAKLGPECYNGYARIINKQGSSVDISADSILDKDVMSVKLTPLDNAIAVHIDNKMSYFNSLNFRKKYKQNSSGFVDELKKKLNIFNAESLQVKLDSLNNLDEQILTSIDYIMDKQDDSLIYINPFQWISENDNPFVNDARLYPIEFPSLTEKIYNFSMNIPAGYKLIERPETKIYSLDNKNSVTFELKCAEAKNSVVIRSKIKINKSFFLPEDYAGLKEVFDHIVKKHNEQLVFKKI